MKKSNIVLIGYRCSGKTSVGMIIAERTGTAFYDTDEMIMKKAGESIEEIVEKDGWDRFREIEKTVISDVSDKDNAVIATGGGVVTDEDNVKNLRKKGRIIWLQGDADILTKRMEKEIKTGNTRPSLTGLDPVVETTKVLEMRNPLYRKAADLIVNTDMISLDEVVERIMTAFRGLKSEIS